MRTEEQSRFLTSLIGSANLDSAWLGATDEQQEGRWVWVDGSEMRYENWDAQALQPNNHFPSGSPEHYLLAVAGRQGVWWDLPDRAQPQLHPGFVCQWGDRLEAPTPVKPVSTAIPDDASAFEGKRYKIFSEHLSWHGARIRCEELGGHLAIVRNERQNEFLKSLAAPTNLRFLWLGASDEQRGRALGVAGWHRPVVSAMGLGSAHEQQRLGVPGTLPDHAARPERGLERCAQPRRAESRAGIRVRMGRSQAMTRGLGGRREEGRSLAGTRDTRAFTNILLALRRVSG